MAQLLKVYGLSENDLAALRKIAKQRYGKANVSMLARDLLLAESTKDTPKPAPVTFDSKRTTRQRIELRLPPHIADYLTRGAEINRMTTNRYALFILMGYVEQHPVLTDTEVKELYKSNYQLTMIGRNINQIARRLNVGETASITSQQIAQLQEFIEQHASKVGDLIRQYRNRTQR